jgi:CBS domain containing-hemolysin-like protein
MQVFNILFFPLTFFLSRFALKAEITNTEKELKSIVNIAQNEKVLEKREATLVKNALDLDSIIVKEVMVKLSDVIAIDKNEPIKNIEKTFKKTGHSRLVVREQKKFLGILHIKDLAFTSDEGIKDKIILVPLISQNIILTKALEVLRIEKSHFAIITTSSEKNNPVGIITLEDILEELIGEIYDEHDIPLPIQEIGLHKFLVLGSVDMKSISKKLNFKFEQMGNPTLLQ